MALVNWGFNELYGHEEILKNSLSLKPQKKKKKRKWPNGPLKISCERSRAILVLDGPLVKFAFVQYKIAPWGAGFFSGTE